MRARHGELAVALFATTLPRIEDMNEIQNVRQRRIRASRDATLLCYCTNRVGVQIIVIYDER